MNGCETVLGLFSFFFSRKFHFGWPLDKQIEAGREWPIKVRTSVSSRTVALPFTVAPSVLTLWPRDPDLLCLLPRQEALDAVHALVIFLLHH